MNLSRVLLFILSLGIGMPIGAVRQNKRVYTFGGQVAKPKELAAGNTRKQLKKSLEEFENQAITMSEEAFTARFNELQGIISSYRQADPPFGGTCQLRLNQIRTMRGQTQRTNPQPPQPPTNPGPIEPKNPNPNPQPDEGPNNPNPNPVPEGNEGGILDTLRQYSNAIGGAIAGAIATGVIYNLLDRENTAPVVNPQVPPTPNVPGTVPTTPTTPNVPTEPEPAPIDVPVTPPYVPTPRPGTGEDHTPIDFPPDSPTITPPTTPSTPPAQQNTVNLFGSDDQDNPVVVERETAVLSPTIADMIAEQNGIPTTEAHIRELTRDQLQRITNALQQLRGEANEGENLAQLLQNGQNNPAHVARWRHLFNAVPRNQRLALAEGTQFLDLPFFTCLLRPRVQFSYNCADGQAKVVELDTALAMRIPRLNHRLQGYIGQNVIPLVDNPAQNSNQQPIEDLINAVNILSDELLHDNPNANITQILTLPTQADINRWTPLLRDVPAANRPLYAQVAQYLGLPLFAHILAPLPVEPPHVGVDDDTQTHQRHPKLEALLRAMKKYRGDVERNLANMRPLLNRREVTHLPRHGNRTARQQQAIDAACQAVVDFKEATFDATYADLSLKIESVYNIMGRVSRGELAGQDGIVEEIHQEARRLIRLLTAQANSVMQTLTNFIGQPSLNADLERFEIREAMHDISKKMKALNGLLLSQSFSRFLTDKEKADFARCLNQMSDLIRYQR